MQNCQFVYLFSQNKVILILLSDSLTTTDLVDGAEKQFHHLAGRVVSTVRRACGPAREDLDDARMLDLDVEQESPFLRGQKRVSVRRGHSPKKTATRLTWGAVART